MRRGLYPTLRFGAVHSLAEEIGIEMEVLEWRKPDRINSFLDPDLAGSWEPGDPMSESDEIAERAGG